jgi:Zn-dependent peptidase ImmA (M78 family)/DNA-binding XRE family transcriptional regulator
MLGERIKQARLASGLSLRALAEKVSVSAQAISKYERGLDVPSSDVLLQLAHVLGVTLDYFFRMHEVKLSEAVYRKRAALRVKDARTVESAIKDWLERYFEIEDILAGNGYKPPEPPAKRYCIGSLDDVESAAESLRQDWNLGVDPIDNLVEVLEDRGVKIGLVSSVDEFDSCGYWANETHPVIAVKRGLPGDRQRFNIAHELGHLLLSLTESMPEEKVAHRFAGAFLMPREAVIHELGMHRKDLSLFELASLKKKYGISMQAIAHRAKDLGVISYDTYLKLIKAFRASGTHRVEPGPQLPEERPGRFERLVIRALEEELISESRAAEFLQIPTGRLRSKILQNIVGGEMPK